MISPSSGVSRPATRLSSVDFPQPDGPIRATNSPPSTSRSTPRSARTGAFSASKVLRTPAHDQAPDRCVVRLIGRTSAVGRAVACRERPGAARPRCQPVDDLARDTGVSRPLTSCGGSGIGVERRRAAPAAWPRTARSRPRRRTAGAAGRGSPCRRPACTRAAPPSRAARRRPRRWTARARGRRRAGPRAAQRALTSRLRGVHRASGRHRPLGVVGLRDRRAEHRHHRVADELHDRAALAEDGPVHRGAVHVELPGQLARVGVLGDGRVRRGCRSSARSPSTPSVSPIGRPLARAASRPRRRAAAGTASRPAPRGRRWPRAAAAAGAARPAFPADTPCGQLHEQRLDLGVHRLGRCVLRPRRWP